MVQEPKKLYSAKVDVYELFVSVFSYRQGLRAFFAGADWLRPSLRVLDAGCGTGIATFALLEALDQRRYEIELVHGFDLTPAMLERFQERLGQRAIKEVNLCQADVLDLKGLPPSWTSYDLIISAGMFEYIPRHKLPEALAGLRSHLSEGGRFLLFITRRNWLTGLLIERLWAANRYSRKELVEVFAAAGFGEVTLNRFPVNYSWLNRWGYIVEGRSLKVSAT